MSSSANEDRDQRKTDNMEKSDSMTIEFLRARLLSERSVSKASRERARDLANRVAELEEQLKFVSLQREKAEKATSDILIILKNHEIGDVSEEFDSSSEHEGNSQDFEARNGSLKMEETSTNLKLRNDEKEAYSSSEIESCPSTGRNLSWKSTRDSQHSLEKKKYIDPVRRRASFPSNSSSSRRIGKSCRRIRRRDTRSVEGLQNDSIEKTAYSKCSSNCSDGKAIASPESSGYANGKDPLSGRSNGNQKNSGHYFNVLEKDEDMESALLHQAQLIYRHEEEEKAQRDWEEKFRENNSGTQDSCDPGNYSDMTEELYEAKSLEQSGAAGKLDSDNQEVKEQPANAHAGELPQISKVSPPAADDNKGSLRDQKYSTSIAAPESLASEFSFPKSEKSLEDFAGRAADEASRHRPQQYVPTVSQIEHALRNTSPSYAGKSTLLSRSSSSLELAVVPQETSSSLGSVLEALQRAKLSLSEKLSSSPQVAEGKSGNVVQPPNVYTNTMDGFQIPFGTSGPFRLPTDYEFDATASVNPGIGVRPSLTNIPYEYAADRFLTVPYVEPRSAVPGDLFHTASSRSLTPEMRSAAAPPHRFLSQPWLQGGDPSPSTSTNHLNPLVPPSQELYPFSPHISVPNIPSNEEEISRTLLSSERGLPPFMRLSSYDGHAGPSMYR
ncbi:hypothetical protein SASPL_101261 [Salvia splendens]|uniref:Uncharacterized protein n=2 Tax=Salvia splendens TaxID=180675 RepID=A0A8X9ADS0_SALSN|nr:uncharacterized protein LOC121742882 isoform X1 [Salvia splendens]XP_041991945.1 uncharacterized protein LOC121742882 isoform X1 [Salvia splendens]KAG6436364.1 hypothetical protein SASPL_101261 [Salvia splendens]